VLTNEVVHKLVYFCCIWTRSHKPFGWRSKRISSETMLVPARV